MSSSITRRTTLAGLGAAAATTSLAADPATAGRHHDHPLIGRPRHDRLHVMTFNIRYAGTDVEPDDPDHWPTRRPALVRILRQEQPSLLGVQEALFDQLAAVEEALPRHRMVGFGREGGSKGEYSSVFYDADRFTVLEWDQRWLSDTPDVIASATWGNTVTRIYTWARLRDKATRRELVMLNTHFDHQSEPARARSAQVLADLQAGFEGLPVILTGDFNAAAGSSDPYRLLVTDGPYRDTWETARRRLTPGWGTFPGYEDPVRGGDRIDWLLTTPSVRVHEVGINTTRPRGVWPSDHAPVQALVSL